MTLSYRECQALVTAHPTPIFSFFLVKKFLVLSEMAGSKSSYSSLPIAMELGAAT